MTQEEKSILLKDLCARLPYGVIVQQSPKYIKGDIGYDIANKSEKEPKDFNIIGIEGSNCLITDKKVVENTYSKGKVSTPVTICIYNDWTKQTAKPYLRPMSSMTEEEKGEFGAFVCIDEEAWNGDSIQGFINQAEIMIGGIDYLLAHYFDFRGLIKKGLALEAPEGMYNN